MSKKWKFEDEQLCEICCCTLRTQQEKEQGICAACANPLRGEFASEPPGRQYCEGCGEPLEDYRERQAGMCANCLAKQKTPPIEEVHHG